MPTMCMGPGTPESQCGVADGERAVLSSSEEMSGLIQENGSWEAVKCEGGTQDALQCFLELSWSRALELFSPSTGSLETAFKTLGGSPIPPFIYYVYILWTTIGGMNNIVVIHWEDH